MRSLLVDALRNDGYDLVEACDGCQLLSRLGTPGAQWDIDLLVADVHMPFCTGVSALMSIRRAGWIVPVILMTSFSDPETRTVVEGLGAVLLDKPFALDDLRSTVVSMLPRV